MSRAPNPAKGLKREANPNWKDYYLILDPDGYALAKFLGQWIRANRLAWVYYHGPIPKGLYVHHRNHDKLDNSQENLELMLPGEHASHHRLLDTPLRVRNSDGTFAAVS